MYILSGAMLFVIGVIHLLPLAGVLGAARLSYLYGVDISDQNLLILMQHRAILFGLLGAFLVGAAFVSDLRWIGYGAAFVSVVSFLIIAWQAVQYNQQIGNVVLADLVALACLVVGVCGQALAYSGFRSTV